MGIVRYRDGEILLELVLETKGKEELEVLQYTHEARKIRCAQEYFHAIGIDYRVVSDQTMEWWMPDVQVLKQKKIDC